MIDFGQTLSIAIGWVFSGAPFAVAMLTALLLPVAVVITSRSLRTVPNHIKLTLIFGTIVLGTTLSIAISGRVLVNENDLAATQNLLLALNSSEGNPWISRISHLFVLTLAFSEIFLWITRKKEINTGTYSLWLAALLYYIASNIVSGVFSEKTEYGIKILYAPVVFTAAVLLIDENYQKFLNQIRPILFIPLVISLAFIYINPLLVMESGYKSLIPGFTIRLAGITDHANSLGALSVIALLIEFSKLKKSNVNLFFLLTSAVCLLLSQSKTSWFIFAAGVALIYSAKGEEKNIHSLPQLKTMTTIVFATIIAMIFLLYKFNSILDFFAQDKTGLTTLTGRTKIWTITVNEFFNNPLFGYGPTIWNIEYRSLKGMLYVGQAHNQYIQTLGQAGLIGVIFLLNYIFRFFKLCITSRHAMRPLAFAMTLVLLTRGFSESPMRMQSILDIDTFVHLIAFVLVAYIAFTTKKTISTTNR
nr:O-antigen ligase family protein [uncultured Rhodoferax sp.]